MFLSLSWRNKWKYICYWSHRWNGGHCVNLLFSLLLWICSSSVGSALPRRRCCAYITIGMMCVFIGVGLTVSITPLPIRIPSFLSALSSQLYHSKWGGLGQPSAPGTAASLAHQAQKLSEWQWEFQVPSMELCLVELAHPGELVTWDPFLTLGTSPSIYQEPLVITWYHGQCWSNTQAAMEAWKTILLFVQV